MKYKERKGTKMIINSSQKTNYSKPNTNFGKIQPFLEGVIFNTTDEAKKINWLKANNQLQDYKLIANDPKWFVYAHAGCLMVEPTKSKQLGGTTVKLSNDYTIADNYRQCDGKTLIKVISDNMKEWNQKLAQFNSSEKAKRQVESARIAEEIKAKKQELKPYSNLLKRYVSGKLSEEELLAKQQEKEILNMQLQNLYKDEKQQSPILNLDISSKIK